MKDRSGEIEALCLSRRDCDKLKRGPRSAGGPERIEKMTGVEWLTWDEWKAMLANLREVQEQRRELPPAACRFCELVDCACVD